MNRNRRKTAAKVAPAEMLDPASLPANNEEEALKRGLIYHARGEQDKAVADLQKAIGLNPDSVDAHYNLGLIYRDMGRAGDARKAFQAALDRIEAMEAQDPVRAHMITRLATWQVKHLETA